MQRYAPHVEQRTNITLGPRYAVRLEDLREWHVLEVQCFACRHIGVVYPSRLQKRWPGHTRLKDLEPKFRCTKCGNRSDNTWQVMQLPR